MNILHVGWGFIPWRWGGLIQYAHDLMGCQVQNGYSVSYFFAGRKYPFGRVPKITKWSRNGVSCYEIINSPIIHGGDNGTLAPGLKINEPISEMLFRTVLDELRPKIIHVHELAGLPSSLIEIAKNEYHLPVVMTLADYFLLCPTLKLFTYLHERCRAFEIGETCQRCCLSAPRDNRYDVEATMSHRFSQSVLNKYIPRRAVRFLLKFLRAVQVGENQSSPDIYQLRRNINISRLRSLDLLIARTQKVADIYRYYLGDDINIMVMNPTLQHIDNIVYSRLALSDKVRFVTLNGLASVQKGAQLLTDTIKILNDRGYTDGFELYVYGYIDPAFRKKVEKFPNVIIAGTYQPKDLNIILEGMHAGIVPSVWDEVFGYVGIEMLSKGVPLISNNVGGISDYALDGVNCVMNNTSTSAELSSIMENIIKNPQILIKMNDFISKHRLNTYQKHYQDLDQVYHSITSFSSKCAYES